MTILPLFLYVGESATEKDPKYTSSSDILDQPSLPSLTKNPGVLVTPPFNPHPSIPFKSLSMNAILFW